MITVNGQPYEPKPGDGRRLIDAAVSIADQKQAQAYGSLLEKLERALARTQQEAQTVEEVGGEETRMTRADLRKLREDHALTQRALGKLLGYTANYIARLEGGHEPITQRFENMVHAMLPPKKRKKSVDTP